MEVAAQGSGFGFKKYESFTIGTNTYKSAFGGSFIKLPNAIKNKKACINIINKDEQCFDWCLLAHKFYGSAKFSNKAYDYEKYWKDLKRPIDVEYPVSMDKYEEYENLNDMQINVFELKDFKEDGTDLRSSLSILYKSNIHRKNVVNLLLITDKDKCHYVLVKNISRLFNSQGDPRTKYFCSHCLVKSFTTIEKLSTHVFDCANYSESERKENNIKYELPSKEENENIMKFKNEQNSFQHPFHIIADFESTLLPFKDNRECSSKKYQQHIPNSFGLKYCCIHAEYEEDVEVVNNKDPELVCANFIEKIEFYAQQSYDMLQLKKHVGDIIITKDEEQESMNATNCKSSCTLALKLSGP